jgi:hypothetical protein
MGETPDELRAEIAVARADMSQTLDELGDKISPKQVARRKADRVRRSLYSVRETIMGSADQAGGRVNDMKATVVGRAQDMAETVQSAPEAVKSTAQGNPLAAGLIAFGCGLLLASVVPATSTERELAASVGEHAQPIVEQAKESAGEVKDDLQQSAKAAAVDVAREAASNVKDSAKEGARQVREQATS